MTTETNHNAAFTSLSHRVRAEPPVTPDQLSDCINPALERAAAIADLMEVAFELDMANEMPNLWRAAQAVRFEIMDAQAMLEAYVDGTRGMPEQPDIAGTSGKAKKKNRLEIVDGGKQ